MIGDEDIAVFSDEESAFREMVRASVGDLGEVAEQMDQENEFSWSGMVRLGELRLLAMLSKGSTPKETLLYAVATEELARISAALANLTQLTTVTRLFLEMYGSGQEVRELVGLMRSGTAICSVAMTEPGAGSDVKSIGTVAERTGRGFRLNGTKAFVTAGTVASHALVTARIAGDERRGVSVFLVPLDLPGIEIQVDDLLGARGLGTATFRMRDVQLENDSCFLPEGRGLNQLLSVIDCGRIGIAGLGIGLASAAFDIARGHLSGRHQFGRALVENQALQFQLAQLFAEISAARLVVYNAAMLWGRGPAFSRQAAVAKLLSSDLAMNCATTALQLCGGNGYRRGSKIEQIFRDSKATQIYEGTNEIQRVIIARSVLKPG